MYYQRSNRRRKSRRVSEAVFPAPVRGLLRSGSIVGAPADAAEVLNNFWPTAEGAELRGGSSKIATAGGAVVSLITYTSGAQELLFAATASAIYNVTSPADVDVAPTADVTSLTSGDWSQVQFATPGGQFVVIVNGADEMQQYNGSAWTQINAASTPAITGVATADLTFVWSHKRRLWFVEDGTLSAWYLPVNSIAGAATEFPLDGVFKLGGKLLFGGTWSQDSGDGLDDYAIFVTDQGEIAAYQGTDPSSASTWALIGVYKIGRPLNKNAWFRAGGDFVILTEDGIVPVTEAVSKDRAALQVAAITAPIEDLWQDIIVARDVAFQFSASLWATKTRLLIGAPDPAGGTIVLAANTRTGAWSTVTGWDVQCSTIWQDRFIFGNAAGEVVRGDVGGTDQGASFEGTYVPKFQEFGAGAEKVASHARVIFQSEEASSPSLGCFADYQIGQFPVSQAPTSTGGDVWGTGVWGTSIWGASGTLNSSLQWQGVAAQGFALAPSLIVQSNQITASTFRLVATVLRYETGRAI